MRYDTPNNLYVHDCTAGNECASLKKRSKWKYEISVDPSNYSAADYSACVHNPK